MAKVPKISDAEWEVMQVVWEQHPILASDVVDRLTPKTGWSDRTVKTMLGRLVGKGALTYQEQGNRYLYRPNVSRGECLTDASQSFLQRVFLGDPSAMLLHFVQHANLTPEELNQLKRILEDQQDSDSTFQPPG